MVHEPDGTMTDPPNIGDAVLIGVDNKSNSYKEEAMCNWTNSEGRPFPIESEILNQDR